MKPVILSHCSFVKVLGLFVLAKTSVAEDFDLVINGGRRVMDPETNYDASANVGAIDGKIAKITTGKMVGKESNDGRGLYVAPGLRDQHSCCDASGP